MIIHYKACDSPPDERLLPCASTIGSECEERAAAEDVTAQGGAKPAPASGQRHLILARVEGRGGLPARQPRLRPGPRGPAERGAVRRSVEAYDTVYMVYSDA